MRLWEHELTGGAELSPPPLRLEPGKPLARWNGIGCHFMPCGVSTGRHRPQEV